MSYIRKVIGSNERLVLLTRLHWIYVVEGILLFAILLGLGFAMTNFIRAQTGFDFVGYKLDFILFSLSAKYTQPTLVFGIVGGMLFFILFSKYLSTEIGLTDRRIIHKSGLIMIDIQQVELEDIRGEFVHHGWFGWLLGYGKIHFDCRFIDDVILPATRDPYRLVKAVHTARMRSEHIPDYTETELDSDLARIDQKRIDAYKARENLKRLARLTKIEFNKTKSDT